MTEITKEMKVAAVKAYTEVDGKCRPAAMQKALEAALLFLSPIAGEGKEWQPISSAPKDGTEVDLWCVRHTGKPLRVTDMWWTQSTGWRNGNRDPKIEALARSATHWRLPPSSPGKDGGQEVEAAAWEFQTWNPMNRPVWGKTVSYQYPTPEMGAQNIRALVYADTRPQPASTALVEAPSPQSTVDADAVTAHAEWLEACAKNEPRESDADHLWEIARLLRALKAKSPSSDRAASEGKL